MRRSHSCGPVRQALVLAVAACCIVPGSAQAQSWALPGTGAPGGMGGMGGYGGPGGMGGFGAPANPMFGSPALPSPMQQQGQGQGWVVTPSLRIQETYTNNVNLSSTNRKKDLITEVTPRLSIFGGGPRLQASGTIAATGLLYANETQNNRAVPSANLRGRLEAIERLFYIDAGTLVTQQYQSFLGTQTNSLANTTNNRFTSYLYTLSPSIQRTLASGTSFVIRNDNAWARYGGTSSIRDSYTRAWTGNVEVPFGAYAVGASYNRNSLEYQDQQPIVNEIERGRLIWRPDPSYSLYGTGGHESNNYYVGDRSGATWGGGARWAPIDRSMLYGDWEHRFFGSSYSYGLNHRTRATIWDVRAFKGLNTFPQSMVTSVPVSIAQQLNQSLATTIADPTQRSQAVDQMLLQLGLPANLAIPLAVASQQVFVQERQEVAVTFVGLTNTLGFSLFRGRTESIASQAIIGLNPFSTDTRQRGGSFTWSNKISASASLNWSTTRLLSEVTSGLVGETATTYNRLLLTMPVSTRTNTFGAVRYNRQTSTTGSAYTESAVIVGLDHIF